MHFLENTRDLSFLALSDTRVGQDKLYRLFLLCLPPPTLAEWHTAVAPRLDLLWVGFPSLLSLYSYSLVLPVLSLSNVAFNCLD